MSAGGGLMGGDAGAGLVGDALAWRRGALRAKGGPRGGVGSADHSHGLNQAEATRGLLTRT